MAIVTLQRRSRELGRIRIGQVVAGKNGRGRPEKLDRFRITSASKPLMEKVAALYGGTVDPWTPQNGGAPQWEVVTESNRLPVMVPPQPVSQFYELWSGGGCARRCDGERELLSEKPCMCDPDPEQRECKPTTRLNVILREVEGIGVFRLESHGYNSAVELPEVADFLGRAGGYVTAFLSLEQRTSKKNGQTRQFMVPTLEVDITPTQLLSGALPMSQVSAAPAPAGELTSARPALPSSAPAVVQDEDSTLAAVDTITDLDELRSLYRDLKARDVLTDAVATALTRRSAALTAAAAPVTPAAPAAASAAPSASPDELWQKVLASAPDGWSSQQLEDDFEARTGVDPGAATAADMQRYLDGMDEDALWAAQVAEGQS